MKTVHGCANYHDSSRKDGIMMMKQTPSILYADLSDPALHQLPYSQ